MYFVKYNGKRVIKYIRTIINKRYPDFWVKPLFLFNQSINQKDIERINPPIQTEVTASSMPNALEIPRPAPTAIVQTGQTARIGVATNRLITIII